MRTEGRRKRSRRIAGVTCCLALSLALVSPRTCALSTVSIRRPKRVGVGAHNDDTTESVLMEVPPREETRLNSARAVPVWLKRLEDSQLDDAKAELDWLEYALLEQQFSVEDVREILKAIKTASRGDASRLVGTIDFCRLILRLKEPTGDMFVTKDVLLASALHYADCITARETGVYEMVKEAISGGTSSVRNRPLPFQLDPNTRTYSTVMSPDDITESSPSSLTVRNTDTRSASYQKYGNEVMRIAKGAAQVKQAEILASAVLNVGRIPSSEEASRLRGLLLSVMEDWRALAIRAVACLYRLEGILHESRGGTAEYMELSQEVVTATRAALHVYAPLAQRLGMQRLKAKLEDRAFRIMYRRQYRAVSSLYKENGDEMRSLSSSLSSHIDQVLRQNPALMGQLENLRVASRVKEPYSLWKKMLKLRADGATSSSPSLVGSTESSSTSSELSLLDVKDGIAVRIILTARKWSPDEPEETTRARERLLCYYVQHLLRNYWPVADKTRVKDYIQYPKPNGYQSLHYTSFITNEGRNWPFEVQVRSEEMHRIAEYGVAAHWDYKLANKELASLSPSLEKVPGALPQLDSVREDEKDRDMITSVSEKSYIDALETAREDLVQQKVFVFFAGSSAIDNVGQLLSLPVGAKVDDALSQLNEQLDTEIDHSASNGSVLRNGRVAKGDEYVGNGDVLLITL